MDREWYEMVAVILVIVGALNWALASFDYNIVDMIFGGFAQYVYWLVGLSGLWLAYDEFMQ